MRVEAIRNWFYNETMEGTKEKRLINNNVRDIFLSKIVCDNRGLTEWVMNNVREDKYYDLINGITKSGYLNDNVMHIVSQKIIRYCLVSSFSGEKLASRKLERMRKTVMNSCEYFVDKNEIPSDLARDSICDVVDKILSEDMLDKITKEIINDNLEYFFKNKDICQSEYLMRFIIGNVYRNNYDCLVNLIFKCEYLHSGMVLVLLDNMKESDINKKYSDQKTILIKAIENGRLAPKTIEKILEKNVDIDAKDKYGMTAMHYACSGSEKDLERLDIYIDKLLEKGARLDIKDNQGRTPLNCVDWDEYYFGIVDIMPRNDDNLFVNIKLNDYYYFKLGNKVAYLEQKIKNIIDKLITKGAKKEEISERFRKTSKDKKINKIKKYFRAFVRDWFFELTWGYICFLKFKELKLYCLAVILVIDTIIKVDEYKFAQKRKEPMSFLDITKNVCLSVMSQGMLLYACSLNRVVYFGITFFITCFGYKNQICSFLRNLSVIRFEKELKLYNNDIVNNYIGTREGLSIISVDGAEQTKKMDNENSRINNMNDISDIGETDSIDHVRGIGKNKIQLTQKDRENIQNTKEQGKVISK